MMDLTGRLRQRSRQVKETAQVDCGGLGTLTVQALSLREGQALSKGPDGDRALLYAACRQLQSAGEQLRREGRLFRPDEIMQLVSDEEARAGAAVVRQLSGLGTAPGQGEEQPSGEGREEPETAPGAGQVTAAAAPEAPASLPKSPEDGNQMDKIRPSFVQNPLPLPIDGSDAREEKSAKVRLGPVQDFEKQVSETRQISPQRGEVGQVSRESAGKSGGLSGENPPADAGKKGPVYGMEQLPQTPKMQKKTGEKSDKFDKIPPAPPPAKGGGEGKDPSPLPPSMEKELHESESELGEVVHETKSELPAQTGEGLHEIKSELGEGVHETKSEFPARTGEGLHESESELGEGVHETKSEFPARTEDRPCRSQTGPEGGERPLNPVTEDLAREVARVLVEGLRRAAGAR
ncbi:hypothetical protein LIZ34_15430 [Intestinimonas butyriciproducens]|uniref:hypothetical protein n=1 Tax=Intestinimonas butyriciproducens TaxID=1297617 RepID=UPI001D0649D6|nr:hypothetical protein [Intestinimonas butyriciproducens]MCB7051738.1 hypothetical protein [Intestinimonas butyriciproducens]